MEFKNADVAAKYVPCFTKDQQVKALGQYDGLLSNITLEVADGMIKRKTNLFKLKDAIPVVPPANATTNTAGITNTSAAKATDNTVK